jgi:hypothetical protein
MQLENEDKPFCLKPDPDKIDAVLDNFVVTLKQQDNTQETKKIREKLLVCHLANLYNSCILKPEKVVMYV